MHLGTHLRRNVVLYENILVPVDGSEHSLQALDNAIQIAKKFDGKITLIHVAPSAIVTTHMHGINVVEPQYSAIEESLRKAGSDLISEAQKRVNAEKVQVETLLKDGHAVKEILDTCREGAFDLVVMGARGHTLLTHLVESLKLGSVSDNVVHHAPCPVLIVRATKESKK